MQGTEKDTAVEEPKAATIVELKAALPDSGAEFREQCQLQGATLAQAKDLWLERSTAAHKELQAEHEKAVVERDQLKAENEQLKKGAGEDPSITVNHAGEGDASGLVGQALWEREWEVSPETQKEFNGAKSAYLAFRKADDAGLVNVLGRR